METETHQPRSSGHGRTRWLWGFLVLLLAGWGFLIVQVPMLLQQVFPDFLVDRESGVATLALCNQNVRNPWSQEINFDVHSGELDWKMSREVDDVYLRRGTDPEKRGFRIESWDRQLANGTYRLMAPRGSGIPDREFQFPQYPYQINDRFAVTADARDLVVMDFTDESLAIKKTNVGGMPIMGSLKPIEGVDGFLRIQFIIPSFGSATAHRVQHFSISDDLVANPGLTWPALIVGTIPYQCVANSGDQIVSINPTSFEIEFRDVSDGKLIESMPMLDGMDPMTMPCGFWENYLRVEPTAGSPRFLDLRRRQWLPPIEGDNFGPFKDIDGKFILFSGNRRTGWGMKSKVFDIDQQAVISEFDSYARTDFIDKDYLLDVSFFSGLTFRKIDVQTGAVVQTSKPFWWVIPITSLLCIGWLVWSWCWLNRSRRGGSIAVWIDVALVALTPLVLCIFRLKHIGFISDLSRVPTQVSQAIILALMLCGVVWMVHTKLRIVPRILPFLLATAVLAASVSITFEGQFQFVIVGATKAMVPVSVYFVCFLVLRRLGYRLLPPDSTHSSEPSQKVSSVTIRDMFVLMAALALLFAGLSPWLPGFADISRALTQVLGALVFFVTLSLPPVFAWWLAMTRTRSHLIGNLLFLVAFGFLLVSTAYRFTGESSLILTLFGVFPTLDILPTFSFVATYWVAACFRFRGWQFRRGSAAVTSEV